MSKFSGKQRLSALLIIMLFVLAIKFLSIGIIESNYKKDYQNKDYFGAVKSIKKLFLFNFFEPYIAHFNYANALYYQKEFANAEKEYNKSLMKNPPENRVCDIRINLALSIESQADILNSLENYDDAKKMFEKARKVLYEYGCANEFDDNGKSERAEEVEEKIKQKEENTKESEDENNQSDEGTENEIEDVNKTSEEELKELLKEVQKKRQEQQQNDEIQIDGSYPDYYDKNW